MALRKTVFVQARVTAELETKLLFLAQALGVKVSEVLRVLIENADEGELRNALQK